MNLQKTSFKLNMHFIRIKIKCIYKAKYKLLKLFDTLTFITVLSNKIKRKIFSIVLKKKKFY